MIKIQKQKPKRTCAKVYACYRSFKPFLRKDFNERCGYCDDHDYSSGGFRSFHIEHFKPYSISVFEELKTTYSNLIYSCFYCNNAKSSKWKDSSGFIDPCENEYDNHLARDKKGKIQYKTERGKYIFENLKLGLKRHELLWCIDKLQEQKQEIKLRIGDDYKDTEKEILVAFLKVSDKIDKYTSLFQREI